MSKPINSNYLKSLLILYLLISQINNCFGFKLNTINLDSISDQNLEIIFSNVQIVGLGEATHGDYESQLYRMQISKFLVNRYEFRIICIEEDYNTVNALNTIIHSDTIVDLHYIEEIIAHQLLFFQWKTKEFVNYIHWLNIFNLNRKDKVSIHGVVDIEKSNTYSQADSSMAFNILKLNSNGKKVIFLAHNIHVSIAKDIWHSFMNDYRTCGNILKSKLGDKYYSLGLIFDMGKFNAWNGYNIFSQFELSEIKRGGSIIKYCRSNNLDNHFIDFNKINLIEQTKEYKKSSFIWSVGASFNPKNPNFYREKLIIVKSWDGIVFKNKLTPNSNFSLCGIYFTRIETKINSINLKILDSMEIIVNYQLLPKDSFTKAKLYIKTQLKNKTIEYYNVSVDSNSYFSYFDTIFRIKIKLDVNTKEVIIGLIYHGAGKISINSIKLVSGTMARSIDLTGFKIICIGNFRIKMSKHFPLIISNLNEKDN